MWVIASICWVVLPSALFAQGEVDLQGWAAGPVRWLLLPEERKELKRIESDSAAAAFIDEFWRRRVREPTGADDSFRNDFVKRVEAADILYADEEVRGSLTDRGRALVLMGPPTHVTVTTEPVMAWDPANIEDERVTMRNADVEIWGYRMEDLPAGMLQIWMAKKKKAAEDTLTLTLMFRNVGPKTVLVDGEPLLEAAARSSVRLPEP